MLHLLDVIFLGHLTLRGLLIAGCSGWGGWYYLRHKYHTWQFERTENNQQLITAWECYLKGTPGIVAAMLLQTNWIFAGLEAGGILMMYYGLQCARRGLTAEEIEAEMKRYVPAVYAAIGAGILFSLWYFGTLLKLTQLLEMGASFTFLIGLMLQMRKNNGPAYVAYLAMIGFAGYLLTVQGIYILSVQQAASFGFTLDSLRRRWMKRKRKQ